QENGCELPYEERPKYGRALIPIAPGVCRNVFYTRNMILGEWHPYSEFLYQMIREYFDPAWHLYIDCHFTIE
ncbi:MAG: hypothetical protein ACI4VQ_06305, partial [Clostridia bacterium]